MERQADRDTIAEEAVGQRHGSAPPYAEKMAETSQEEATRQLAASSGTEASIPQRTAESVGERVGDAYSDPGRVAQHPKNNHLLGGRELTEDSSQRVFGGPFVTAVAGFALGYLTAVLLHSRTYSGTTPGLFQITRPPQGDGHPRGFVRSTVLKTITEHPHGMTTAEMIAELDPQGIGQHSIANALTELVQAKKISLQSREGKYFPGAAEVSTAPDQPSS